MQIEDITLDNLTALTRLMLELWPECDYDVELENCERMLMSTHETCFLAKKNDEYVGFIQLAIRMDYVEGTSSSPVAYVEGIYVKPEHRGLGTASLLMKFGETWGREMGCLEYAADTESGNDPGIGFHTRVGFREVSRIVHFVKSIR